jgi:2-dehydro-3-deoxy-D-arabinonate dehydratase
MLLTRHITRDGPRWALDGYFLPAEKNLSHLLGLRANDLHDLLTTTSASEHATGPLSAPVDPEQEIWASGVTYLRSTEARVAESKDSDVYTRVYLAERPELFFKSSGARACGHGQPVRVRRDSRWNVPEPEITLVANRYQEIIGYCAGNDISSRSIESENPLYLPQAKIYDGALAIGPGIRLAAVSEIEALEVNMEIQRNGGNIFQGGASARQMKRSFQELLDYLYAELSFEQGVLLLTGTGIVPLDEFTLQTGDEITIRVGDLEIKNKVTE